MIVPAILKQLATLPSERCDFAPYGCALRAALEQREAIVPALISAVEAAIANPVPYCEDPDDTLHVFAIYLLAQFQEPRALDPFLRFFSLPSDLPVDLTGHLVPEHGAAVLASVCGGDPAPLLGLIHNETVNRHVRNQAVTGLAVQALWAERTRDAVLEELRRLFGSLPRPGDSLVWTAVVESAFVLPPLELRAEILEVLSQGLIPLGFCALEEVEGDLVDTQPWRIDHLRQRAAPIDAVACCRDWLRFWSEGDDAELDEAASEEALGFGDSNQVFPEPSPGWEEAMPLNQTPDVAPPKVGRNGPCPCGSGKKFKKCCGGEGGGLPRSVFAWSW